MSSSDELSICFAAATVPSFLKKVTNVEIRSSLRPCTIPCSIPCRPRVAEKNKTKKTAQQSRPTAGKILQKSRSTS